jgi:hypothetical protein
MKNNYGYVVMQIIPNIDFSFFNCELSSSPNVVVVSTEREKEKYY